MALVAAAPIPTTTGRRLRTALAAAVVALALAGAGGAHAVETPLGEDGGGQPIDNGATLLELEEDDGVELQLDAEDDAILDALPPPPEARRPSDAPPWLVVRAVGR